MKQNGVVASQDLHSYSLYFDLEGLIPGPKSYRDIRETGSRAVCVLH